MRRTQAQSRPMGKVHRRADLMGALFFFFTGGKWNTENEQPCQGYNNVFKRKMELWEVAAFSMAVCFPHRNPENWKHTIHVIPEEKFHSFLQEVHKELKWPVHWEPALPVHVVWVELNLYVSFMTQYTCTWTAWLGCLLVLFNRIWWARSVLCSVTVDLSG